MKSTIYIVRHGESVANSEGRVAGHSDSPLSAIGLKQADLAAQALADVKLDAVYSSDLTRAYTTALPHAELRGLEVTRDARLRELFVGDMENMLKEDIVKRYGTLYTVDWHEHFGTFVSPNGESVPEAVDRVEAALLDIGAANLGKTVLVATHAGVLRAFWGRISGIAPEELCERINYATNASYSVVEYDGGRLIPVSYSNDGYLGNLRTEWKDR